MLKVSHRIIITTLILCLIGLVFVWSASSITAARVHGTPLYYVQKQFLWLCIGFVMFTICANLPLDRLRQFTFPLLMVVIALLIAVYFQRPINGAYRWLILGPISVQPSEFAKLALIFYAAHKYAQAREMGKSARDTLLPILTVVLVLVALIFNEPDRGTSVIILLVIYALSLLAGIKKKSLLLLLLVIVPYAYFDFFMNQGYRFDRINVFLNPMSDPLGKGYQVTQSSIAIGSGGIFGVGIGEGTQKIFYLPEGHTDFIFAVICEETGFIGAAIVIFLYIALILQIMKVATEARSYFHTYLVFGLSYLLTVQVFINIGVAVGALPTKGLALPFLSYGGSSMLAALTLIGLVVNIAKQNEKEAPATTGSPIPITPSS
ncbi:putative lipid II flippase FtsW [Chrysiogenes arsenatis]|uniref:putative lipid II flippase FtsW n=1 Tax=Chrysiogenes arsenatis TaxID=309797 RepID=UPI000411C37C|nr:putative lipid II flippase FtsW [Chrysiogenes arsenatis]